MNPELSITDRLVRLLKRYSGLIATHRGSTSESRLFIGYAEALAELENHLQSLSLNDPQRSMVCEEIASAHNFLQEVGRPQWREHREQQEKAYLAHTAAVRKEQEAHNAERNREWHKFMRRLTKRSFFERVDDTLQSAFGPGWLSWL